MRDVSSQAASGGGAAFFSFGGSKPSFGEGKLSFGGSIPSFGGSKRWADGFAACVGPS